MYNTKWNSKQGHMKTISEEKEVPSLHKIVNQERDRCNKAPSEWNLTFTLDCKPQGTLWENVQQTINFDNNASNNVT